ncbi:CLUMA_CG004885, isoform A [Clunio marinus]|uniref:CLUMA_CG004885, isoform A n=1 Tax=Clunio marinus TaxID=568069 RepID=A0A1J1HUH7_9DIPT|nr:CLUMA_CG004885, isoform A [Clunio marinus]
MDDPSRNITLNFKLLTGGTFTVGVDSDISVDSLKKIVSKKLKISKDRICLMNSERELQDGTLKENGIVNDSKIIITPNVESGLAQRTENTVLQALESLNDNQVNDFLSGKSPLNLSVRLGDHMMLIQLQLSTLSPSQQNSLKQKVVNASKFKQQQHQQQQNLSPLSIINPQENDIFLPNNSMKRPMEDMEESSAVRQKLMTSNLASNDSKDNNKSSPIKSLSSMVSSPLSSAVQNMHQSNKLWQTPVDPISANLTSCLCKRLSISCNNNCGQRSDSAYVSFGTLNPTLQDKNGRPKRDISTIIHILNDLLSATPQCSRNGAKIFFEPTQPPVGPSGKFIKIKKQSHSRSSCVRCAPPTLLRHTQSCSSDEPSTSTKCSSEAHYPIPSTSSGIVRGGSGGCSDCNKCVTNRKLEIENMKTKTKLDQLKLVMKQKKERREARKLKIAPYNNQHESMINVANQASMTSPSKASPTKGSNNKSLVHDGETTHHVDSSSPATATAAIATSISPNNNNSEMENHLEEVDSVA